MVTQSIVLLTKSIKINLHYTYDTKVVCFIHARSSQCIHISTTTDIKCLLFREAHYHYFSYSYVYTKQTSNQHPSLTTTIATDQRPHGTTTTTTGQTPEKQHAPLVTSGVRICCVANDSSRQDRSDKMLLRKQSSCHLLNVHNNNYACVWAPN